MLDARLNKYAKLIVRIGANVQEGQILVVNAPVESAPFTRLVVEEAYKLKAKYVIVKWNDDLLNKTYFTYVDDEEVLKEVPEYIIKQFEYFVDQKTAVISISAPTPELLKDIDPKKLQISAIATNKKLEFYRKHMMSNGAQWTIAAYPTLAWAEKVFPDLPKEKAYDKLLDSILSASRVRSDNDPILEWENHMARLATNNKKLNEYNFESLYFENSLGTKLSVGLVKDHIWAGGGETAKTGVYFAPNIPTEETFTMPHRLKVNGRVVATKPLSYQGKLIEDFVLEFKDGKVVSFSAKTEEATLKSLLELDEGSSYLGELALISHDSPISNTNILFYNTLFDENASCHLALGNAYTMNIKDGNSLKEEELIARGYNKSMTHVDFMFGSSDMKIVGQKYDKTKVVIFEKGNFVF